MKKMIGVIVLAMSVASLARATDVIIDYTDGGLYPGGVGNPCSGTNCGALVSGSQSQVTFTPEPLQQIIQQQNITVPASIGLSSNGGTQSTVGSLNFVGTGVTNDASGNVDLSNLQTNQSIQNTTDISNLQSGLTTTNTNVSNLSSNVSNLSTEVNQNSSNINAETVRAEGAESTLQQNITNETNRATTVENHLQQQITNVGAQTQDNTNRIDRLEETKILVEPAVRLYDGKYFQVQAFDSYNARIGMNDAVGARVVFKLGKSYEEKLLEKQNKQLQTAQAEIAQLLKLAGISPAPVVPVAVKPVTPAASKAVLVPAKKADTKVVTKKETKSDDDDDHALLHAMEENGGTFLKASTKF